MEKIDVFSSMASLQVLQNQIKEDVLEAFPDHKDYMIENLFDVFFLHDDKLVQTRNLLDEKVSMRLNPVTHHESPLKFYPSFIEEVPNGTESGTFLAVDIGGTHCRVLALDVRNRKASTKGITQDIPAGCHENSGTQVFDLIANCLHKLLTECGLLNTTAPLRLGFTFSFPVKKVALDKAILIQWTKDFHGGELIGKDVVQLLHEAITRRGDMNIHCCAIINDTIGTLISGAFKDNGCKVGLICGTGTNGCCFEPMEHCIDYKNKVQTTSKAVAVDTRWNNFGVDESLDFIRSQYDNDIRKDTSDCPMGIEKMMSGMYIGEIVRRVLLKLNNDGLIFPAWPEVWSDVYSLHTETVSDILRVNKNELLDVNEVLRSYGVNGLSSPECRLLHYVCQLVVIRSAYLTAACTACMVNRVDDAVVGIAVDGSVYKNIELFRDVLGLKTKSLLKPGKDCYFVPCEDGSGLGAALVAAMVDRKLR